MSPKMANGKICYVEIPSTDIGRSADFYRKVFGWKTRKRGDGSLAFDDGCGEMSGTWVVGRPPSGKPGLLIYIMVDSVAATVGRSRPTGARSCSRWARTRPRSQRGSATRAEM